LGTVETEQTSEKAGRKTGMTERWSGSIRPRTASTDDNIDALLFLNSAILVPVHKLDIIRKE